MALIRYIIYLFSRVTHSPGRSSDSQFRFRFELKTEKLGNSETKKKTEKTEENRKLTKRATGM